MILWVYIDQLITPSLRYMKYIYIFWLHVFLDILLTCKNALCHECLLALPCSRFETNCLTLYSESITPVIIRVVILIIFYVESSHSIPVGPINSFVLHISDRFW